MIYYVVDGSQYYRTQAEAGRSATPVNVPTDHHGLCDFLNRLIARVASAPRALPQQPSPIRMPVAPPTIYLTNEQRLLSSLEHQANLDREDVDSAEDLLRKVRGGRQLSNGQLNYIDVIYDKAHRRANFSHLPDYSGRLPTEAA